MQKTEAFRIDIEKVIREKNPRLAKLMPGFILRYIRRIIHEEKTNFYLDKYKDSGAIGFSDGILQDWNIKVVVKNEKELDQKGRFVFVANHPLGGLESLGFMQTIHKYHKEFVFPVNDILLKIPSFQKVFIPINKFGSRSKETALLLDEAYASDKQILFFPAGMVSRMQNGKVMDLEWKKTFISKAIQHKRDIIPVHISGENSKFFYRLGSIRKKLGIKANLEMFYLVDEVYKQSNTTMTITIGKRIDHSSLDNSKTHKEWAACIREEVYKLPNE